MCEKENFDQTLLTFDKMKSVWYLLKFVFIHMHWPWLFFGVRHFKCQHLILTLNLKPENFDENLRKTFFDDVECSGAHSVCR